MYIIVLSSRIYGRRRPNDEIWAISIILVSGDYDYRGITADTAVIPSSPLPCSSIVCTSLN